MLNHSRGHIAVTAVTASRLLFAVGVACLIPWSGTEWALVVSLVLLVGIELSDLFDGHLARRNNVVSDFGALFDPYSDSISRLIVYWSLAVIGRCLVVVPLVMAVRDVTVGYARVVLMRKGADVGARLTGKLKAVVQGLCALVLMAASPMWVASEATREVVINAGSAAVLIVTVASMIDYCWAAVRAAQAA